MKDLIEHLQKEWATVSKAPFAFLLLLVLAIAIAYTGSQWRYAGIIDQMRERLAAKDQQLDDYRERLQFSPSRGSVYSVLTHKELQDETLRLVKSMREWIVACRKIDTQRQDQLWALITPGSEKGKAPDGWEHYTSEIHTTSITRGNEYDQKFKVKTIVIHDELLSRLNKADPTKSTLYEHPTNFIGMGMVADDLEKLARLLR